jgi:hypothetical protein
MRIWISTEYCSNQRSKTPSAQTLPLTMAAMKTLSTILPEPKYRDDSHSSRTTREDDVPSAETRLVTRGSGPPPYGRRKGWIPRTLDDYEDGGAFPEINLAQYPLEMGKKKAVFFELKVWTNENRQHQTLYKYKLMDKETSNMTPSYGTAMTVIELFIHQLKTLSLFVNVPM